MIRKKEVAIDGAVFTIAPLTIDQVDEYNERLGALAGQQPGNSLRDDPFVLVMYDSIAWSFNNVAREAARIAGRVDATGRGVLSDAETWDAARVTGELDSVSINTLRDELMLFSGLKIKTVPVDGKPGESAAAAPAAS
jgi:hypothetical protein